MSDEKTVRPKRVASLPKTAPEPAAPVSATLEPVSALPGPEAIVALPATTPRPRKASANRLLDAYQATLASIGKSQTAVVSDVTAMALEVSGLTHANLTTAGDSVTALFASQNVVDAIDIQLDFVRRSLDMIVEGSTRLRKIGLRLANDAAKPMLEGFVAG